MMFSCSAVIATVGQCEHLTLQVSGSWDISNKSHMEICNVHLSINKNRGKVIYSIIKFQHSGSLSHLRAFQVELVVKNPPAM